MLLESQRVQSSSYATQTGIALCEKAQRVVHMLYLQFIWSSMNKYQDFSLLWCHVKHIKFFYFLRRFQCHTAEAAKLEAEVTKAQDTITAAQQLISQLDGEHTRWKAQVVWSIEVLICVLVREVLHIYSKKVSFTM